MSDIPRSPDSQMLDSFEDDYYRSVGHDPQEIRRRTDPAATEIKFAARRHASGLAATAESRNRYIQNLRSGK